MRCSLDIETKCIHGCTSQCDHGLDPYNSRISCVGVYIKNYWSNGNPLRHVFRSLDDLKNFLREHPQLEFVGQNFKFDLKHLSHHGVVIPLSQWGDDTQLMASVSTEKVSQEFIEWYEEERVRRNKELPRGFTHRKASPHSLKVLAPYFLRVEAFWEDPTNHDSNEYVLKDCEYTDGLCEFFRERLELQGTYSFYKTRLLNWTKMLLTAEQKGIALDLQLLQKSEEDASNLCADLKGRLDVLWKPAYNIYFEKEEEALVKAYDEMFKIAVKKKKSVTPETLQKLEKRYAALRDTAIAKIPKVMNIDSPAQISWILKEHYGLDIKDFNNEETTGKEVLQRLSGNGREDVKLYLDYREQHKLATAFFPSYREKQKGGILHASFNPTGTRTGRLSSSEPNLQQVPANLHVLFKARPGCVLITRDLSNIEPIIIAYYTNDSRLCDIVINGRNFHDVNTLLMFDLNCDEKEVKEKYPKERQVAKTVGLALLYGAGPYRIMQSALKAGFNWDLSHCKEIYDNFKAAYREAFEFKKSLDALAVVEPIPNIFGRKHYYADPSEIYMKAFNTLVQSSASDLLLDSTFKAWTDFQKLDIDCYPLLWVHDECVFEAPEEKQELCEHIIEKHLLGTKLQTPHGLIPLKCDGKTAKVWSK